MRAPAELTMLGKTLLHLDEVARALDPTLDVNESIRRNGIEPDVASACERSPRPAA